MDRGAAPGWWPGASRRTVAPMLFPEQRTPAPALRRWRASGAWASLLALAVLAARGAPSFGLIARMPPGEARPSSNSRPNLVLITIDTTRADHLACYGARHAATPNLDAIARSGALFEDVLSPAPLTLPTHASMMTGLTPRRHGVRDNAGFRLEDTHPTLASILSARGYATAAIVGAAVLDRSTGIGRGFESYDDNVRIGRRSEFNYEERAAAAVTDAALSRLASLKAPFFLWVHYYDPHFPYVPPAPFAVRFRTNPYDGEIAYVDAEIGRLLRAPALTSPGGRTLLVVAGDHGEGLGEHGEDRHDLFLYQATQRVPLIIRVPSIPRGHPITQRVGLVDLCPTVLDLLGVPLPRNLDGRSLAPLLTPGARRPGGIAKAAPSAHGSATDQKPTASRLSASPPVYELESFFPAYSYNWAPSIALVHDKWKYVGTPRPELYDLDADPAEARNLLAGLGSRAEDAAGRSGRVTASDLAAARRLAMELRLRYQSDGAARAFAAPFCAPQVEDVCPPRGVSPSSSTSPRRAATDSSQGSLPVSKTQDTVPSSAAAPLASSSSSPSTAGAPRPSPPAAGSLPDDDEMRERLASLGYLGGSVRPGETPAPGPRRDPKDGVGIVRSLDRARALLQGGRSEEAARALEAVAGEDERNFPVLATLGSAYISAGDYDRAIEIHRRTLALRPGDGLPHANVAGALRAKAASLDGARPGEPGKGRADARAATLREDAAKEYEHTLRLAPRDSESYLGYARLELERSRPEAARVILRRAHGAAAADPEIYVLQGRVEAALNETRGARTAFERALAMDPRSGEAHEGLGHLDYEAGDARAAEAHYARALELDPSASRAKTLGAIRLYALSDREGARAAFRRALALSPDAAGAKEIAEILRDLGDVR